MQSFPQAPKSLVGDVGLIKDFMYTKALLICNKRFLKKSSTRAKFMKGQIISNNKGSLELKLKPTI